MTRTRERKYPAETIKPNPYHGDALSGKRNTGTGRARPRATAEYLEWLHPQQQTERFDISSRGTAPPA